MKNVRVRQVEKLVPRVRPLLFNRFQTRQEEPLNNAFACADDNLQGIASAFGLEVAQCGELFARGGVQPLPGWREHDTSSFASHQFGAKELFEFLDLAAV